MDEGNGRFGTTRLGQEIGQGIFGLQAMYISTAKMSFFASSDAFT